jgi:hypothetical protein
MPKVKIFTIAENRKRDRQAKALQRKGYSTSKSFAIATASVKKSKRKKRR